jgi:hypothetical protein
VQCNARLSSAKKQISTHCDQLVQENHQQFQLLDFIRCISVLFVSSQPPLASSQNEDYLAIFLVRHRVLAPDNVQPGAKWRRSSEWTSLRGDFYWKMEEILHFDTAQTLSQFVL